MHRLFNSTSVRSASIVSAAALLIGVSFIFKKTEQKPLPTLDKSKKIDGLKQSNTEPKPEPLLGS